YFGREIPDADKVRPTTRRYFAAEIPTRARGPLGALPALSRTARRALAVLGVLSVVRAGALVAQAFLLAVVLAEIVAGNPSGVGTPVAILGGVVLANGLTTWAIRVVSARAAAGTKEELRASVLDRAL